MNKVLTFCLLLACASVLPAQAQLITAPVTQNARNAPQGPLTPTGSGDTAPAVERVDALELRLSELEQRLTAQRNLQARRQSNDRLQLQQQLQQVQAELQRLKQEKPAAAPAPAPASKTQSAVRALSGPSSIPAAAAPTSAALQTRLNEMAEVVRGLQAQNDALALQVRTLTQQLDSSRQDNEFRFQALESGVLRANRGISSTSAEPEVIGVIKSAAPVQGLAGASAAAPDKLVGEGDLSALEALAAERPDLNDPKALYERGLRDLQAGKYTGAQADFVQLVTDFPTHKLAGNAQYWLGETYYVRQQYKLAAQAFLAGYTKYADSSKAPDSLLKLGMAMIALEQKKTGCDAFAELGAKYPDASAAITKRAAIERERAGCAG